MNVQSLQYRTDQSPANRSLNNTISTKGWRCMSAPNRMGGACSVRTQRNGTFRFLVLVYYRKRNAESIGTLMWYWAWEGVSPFSAMPRFSRHSTPILSIGKWKSLTKIVTNPRADRLTDNFSCPNAMLPNNTSRAFQHAMDFILFSVMWQSALVYLDDIVIFSKFLDEHMDHVRQALRSFDDAGETLKLKSANNLRIAKVALAIFSSVDVLKLAHTKSTRFEA